MKPFPDICDQADQTHLGTLKSSGELNPSGITIHYTADRDLDRTLSALRSRDLGYHFIIDRSGLLMQFVPMSRSVWHAGKAVWNQMSPNRSHIAVSLLSWGELTQLAPGAFESWNKSMVGTTDAALRRKRWWDAATPAQEKTLIEALVWLCQKGIDVSSICGHDECALPAGRKVDPGGVLSMTMEQLRFEIARRLTAAT